MQKKQQRKMNNEINSRKEEERREKVAMQMQSMKGGGNAGKSSLSLSQESLKTMDDGKKLRHTINYGQSEVIRKSAAIRRINRKIYSSEPGYSRQQNPKRGKAAVTK